MDNNKFILAYLEKNFGLCHGVYIDYEIDENLSNEDILTINVEFSKNKEVIKNSFQIPLWNEVGIIKLDRYSIKMLPVIVVKEDDDLEKGEVHLPHVRYIKAVGKAVSNAAFRFNNLSDLLDESFITKQVQSYLTSDTNTRIIPDYLNKAGYKAISEMVIIVREDGTKCGPLKNWEYVVDLNTSPTSDKIGEIYQLALGASVSTGKIIKSTETTLSRLNASNSVFQMLAPTQLYKVRSPSMLHITLKTGEHPIVKSTHYEGDLSGKHFVTAILATPHNQLDQIQISETAASKMDGYYYSTITAMSKDGIDIKVEEGQEVEPNQILATIKTYDNKTEKNKFSHCRQTRVPLASKIKSIFLEQTVSGGILFNRVRFLLETTVKVVDGDKIITRHGAKGVVKIVPDSEMPSTFDGTIVDICIHPVSVANRQNFAIFAEAISYEKALNEDLDLATIPLEATMDWSSELSKGYGKKQYLYYEGKLLEDPTFVGTIFWIRTDSIAQLRVISSRGNSTGFDGLPSDSTTGSGMKVGLDLRQILWAKGCYLLDSEMHKANLSKKAIEHTKLLADSIMQRLEPVFVDNMIEDIDEVTPGGKEEEEGQVYPPAINETELQLV